ncbi:hypothetical protein NPIL_82621 [Nephila pilipes]|uniref:Uncharacterized protein n=1 Tax=Nephila pilipes TaxID=299642 RepID=A0A8X6TZ07_NEPPI|nr:hypothetical protein NPIL_82621 [Nephila pilipes]
MTHDPRNTDYRPVVAVDCAIFLDDAVKQLWNECEKENKLLERKSKQRLGRNRLIICETHRKQLGMQSLSRIVKGNTESGRKRSPY